MTYINVNKNIYALLLLMLTAMIFMGAGVISKAEAGLPLPLPPIETLSIPIGNESDDAEENITNGDMSLTSSDLEFIQNGSKQQIVGLRFPLAVPTRATILNATIQFTVDETGSDPTSLTIHGQDTNNAPTFSSSDFDISHRTLTLKSISWTPSAWPNKGEAGPIQETPNLSAIVQASVDQPDWMQGNAIVFIISGSGKRIAESFNGTAAPVLHVEFSLAPQLKITEVTVDTDTLTITGEAFDFNDILDLKIMLGDSSTGTGPGDITFECTSGTLPTDTSIVCDLSAGGLPEMGDYLLTVSTGADQSQSDEYDLTIGAIGLQGLQGLQGPAGADGQDADTAVLQAQIDALQIQINALQPVRYSIGNTGPAGGKVFHITNGGLHGLEAAPVDRAAVWCSSLIDIAGVDTLGSSEISDRHSGAQNTPLIKALCGPGSAAGIAANYVWPNGQTDGFLPNKEELNLLFDQRIVVGGFAPDVYWSSSVHDSDRAWLQNFEPSFQVPHGKFGSLRFRAVRAF